MDNIFKMKRWGRHQSNDSYDNSTLHFGPPAAGSEFGKHGIRLVIFRDHDLKGRHLIFDSKSVSRLPNGPTNGCRKWTVRQQSQQAAQGGEPPRFSQLKHSSDTKVLGEMMFGSESMAFKGSPLKVHLIRNPHRLMVTRVFVPSKHSKDVGVSECGSFECSLTIGSETAPRSIQSDQITSSIAHSVPVDVPSPPSVHVPQAADTEDSGISGSMTSSYSSQCTASVIGPSSPGSSTSDSYNSIQRRRLIRSQTTSLEYCVNHRSSNESASSVSIPLKKRPNKYGVALLFNLPDHDDECYSHFQEFFFSHFTLIQGHVQRLKLSVERAVLKNAAHFNPLVCEALDHLRDSVWDLYTAPRLSEPVWLNMLSYSHKRRLPLCSKFIKEFVTVIDKLETKNTKFFMSTLLTGVLTYHLAWVPTVTPAGVTPSFTYLEKHSAKWLDTLAKSHPYNPLWAQLSDLYGALGFPLRLSRTVITGRKSDIVKRLLYVLSYFIRCSEVCESSDAQFSFFKETDSPPCASPLATPQMKENDASCHAPIEVDKNSFSKSCIESSGSSGNVKLARSKSCSSLQNSCDIYETNTIAHADSSQPVTNFTDPPPVTRIGLEKNMESHFGHLSGDQLEAKTMLFYKMLDSTGDEPSLNEQSKSSLYPSLDCLEGIDNKEMCSKLDQVIIHVGENVKSVSSDLSQKDSKTSQLSDSTICNSKEELAPVRQLQKQVSKASSVGSEKSKKSVFESIGNDLMQFTAMRVGLSRTVSHLMEEDTDNQTSGDNTGVEVMCSEKNGSSCEGCDNAQTMREGNEMKEWRYGLTQDLENRRKITQVRLVGKDANVRMHSGYLDDVCTQNDVRDTQVKDFAVDSGVFDSPESSRQNSEDRELTQMSKVSKSCNEGGKKQFDFSRSNSIFDEYFDQNVELLNPRHAAYIRSVSKESASSITDAPLPNESLLEPFTEKAQRLSSSSSGTKQTSAMIDTNGMVTSDKTVSALDSTMSKINISEMDYTDKGTKNYTVDDNLLVETDSDAKVDRLACNMANVSTENIKDRIVMDSCINVECRNLSKEMAKTVAHENESSSSEIKAIPTFNEHKTNSKVSARPKNGLKLVLPRQGSEESYKDTAFSPRTLTSSIPNQILLSSSPNQLGSVKSHAGTGPARCRPVTPTELRRRRHVSTASTFVDTDSFDISKYSNVDLPSAETSSYSEVLLPPERNFGRSLFADFSDHYMSDFVLQGTNDPKYAIKLHNDLTTTVQNSVLDEQIAETACLVADTDKWSVKLHSCQYHSSDRVRPLELTASSLVCNIVDTVHQLWKLKMSPEFCIMHLEDRLQEIYLKSKMLSEYIKTRKRINMTELSEVLGFDLSDITLLLAVAGTHTPHLLMGLVD